MHSDKGARTEVLARVEGMKFRTNVTQSPHSITENWNALLKGPCYSFSFTPGYGGQGRSSSGKFETQVVTFEACDSAGERKDTGDPVAGHCGNAVLDQGRGALQPSYARAPSDAQLIGALSGGHVWADHLDGSLADSFALQDKRLSARPICLPGSAATEAGWIAREPARLLVLFRIRALSLRVGAKARDRVLLRTARTHRAFISLGVALAELSARLGGLSP